MVELLAFFWAFHATVPPLSQLDVHTPRAKMNVASPAPDSFTVQFDLDLNTFDEEKNILEIQDVLKVKLRRHNPNDRRRQNYPAFKRPDGSVPVLEAELTLHSQAHPDWKTMTIGLPLAMLEHFEGRHDVVLHFSGARWTLYVDGILCDNDFPFGYPRWSDMTSWTIDPKFVRKAAFHSPGITPKAERPAEKKFGGRIQYWTPPGHNAWVGDVACLYHDGRYHVFYLYDRRHHASKFGKGAHYFEHLSTADFKTWTEHAAATPIDEQWECIGTGTPFIFDGKFCLSYGLHTRRVYPPEKTTLPEMKKYLHEHGRTGRFDRSNIQGVPAGATYSVFSKEKKRFEKTGILFHPCENPSIFIAPDGTLRMAANFAAKGFWESKSVDEGWRCTNPDFPPGGDCTFYFRWGAFDYVIGGFKDLWSKPVAAPDTEYRSLVEKGLDFYDGSNVPSIVQVMDERMIMAAWIPIHGWGGNLVIRELLQLPDGRIGSKWMPEITPETAEPKRLSDKVTDTTTFETTGESFLLSFEVDGLAMRGGKLGILFLPAEGENEACEFQLGLGEKRAQFASGNSNGFSEKMKSIREGGNPQGCRNYAIENLIGTDERFTVRIFVKGCDKIGGSLIDAEIAGSRTMITFRPNLTVGKLLLRKDRLPIENLRISPLVP